MSGDPHVVDMAALRSKLLVAQSALRDEQRGKPDRAGELDPALQAIDEALEMLYPRLDPDVVYPDVSRNAITQAAQAAHDALIAAGVQNPVEILIVQAHDANGHTTGRTLASSAANPQDLLRLCLENVRQGQ